jgi:hypothetical protein
VSWERRTCRLLQRRARSGEECLLVGMATLLTGGGGRSTCGGSRGIGEPGTLRSLMGKFGIAGTDTSRAGTGIGW